LGQWAIHFPKTYGPGYETQTGKGLHYLVTDTRAMLVSVLQSRESRPTRLQHHDSGPADQAATVDQTGRVSTHTLLVTLLAISFSMVVVLLLQLQLLQQAEPEEEE